MKKTLFSILMTLSFFSLVLIQFSCMQSKDEKKAMTQKELVVRGKYLVTAGGCNDCHTPKMMTNQGPVPDTTKLLAGYMSNFPLADIDTTVTNSKWVFANMESTVWVGPWGVSFSANLTPDGATGLGNWTEEIFIKAMKTGKHMGMGRPILPPMPWPGIANLTDEDFKAVFTYLKSINPIKNQVPEPIPPNMIAQAINMKK